jgi:outer membrane protein OmpA-like peptidoglycan-associated protein
MPRLLLIAFLLAFTAKSFTQTKYKHPSILGINFILNDFKNKSFFGEASTMDAGLSINYLKGFSRHFDYIISLSGSFPNEVSKHLTAKDKSLLLQGDFSFRTRLLGKQKWINPFLQFGTGAGTYRSNALTYFLIGPGIEVNYKDVYFNTNLQYRPSLSNKLNNHYFYSIGISGLIGKKQKKKRLVEPPKIQNVFIAKDSDGDGIVDSSDTCPTVPGLTKYRGCPIPDRDKDGISDEEDNCPDVPGILKYKGCPIPDTDGDGINDEQDSCIAVPGLKENQGCPVIKKDVKEKIELAAKNIFFKTGSFELLEKSFAPLDEVVKILKENSSLKLSIDGHTDNVGTIKSNQTLSENRAKAVMQYLIIKGIDQRRLTATGYGQLKPIDTNSTPESRANNRRVELILIY